MLYITAPCDPSFCRSLASLFTEFLNTRHVASNEFILSHVDLNETDWLVRQLSDQISPTLAVESKGDTNCLVGVLLSGLLGVVHQVLDERLNAFNRRIFVLKNLSKVLGKTFPDMIILRVLLHDLVISVDVNPVVVLFAVISTPRFTSCRASEEPN